MSLSSTAGASYPKVEYAIFDMDGLLMYVPRIYTDVTNTILGRYGHQLTWEIKSGVMGKVAREACEYTLSFFPDVLEHITVDEYLAERNAMQEELFKKVPMMAGAAHLVRSLGVPIALATGSTYQNFKWKTGHLQETFSLFPADSIITADSPEVKPGRGKPFPDIFLAAAHSLGRDVGTAEECTEAQKRERTKGVVFEDAVPGVKAGVAADMNGRQLIDSGATLIVCNPADTAVIWVPDTNLRALAPTEDYGSAQVLRSLEEWDPVQWGLKPFPLNTESSAS